MRLFFVNVANIMATDVLAYWGVSLDNELIVIR